MFSRGILAARGEGLVQVLGVQRVEQHAMYLGIPTRIGKSRIGVFRGLVNRISKKFKDLKGRTLSQVEKLTLVKSVVQSIPTYLMTCLI